MRVLFLVAGEFPFSGACTNLINNILFVGRLSNKIDTADVLAFKTKAYDEKITMINDVTVYNTVLLSRISQKDSLRMMKRHPLKSLSVFGNKFLFKRCFSEINKRDVKNIERDLKKFGADKYDVIVSVMGSFEVAFAAMNFKKKNPVTQLVIYQVDPLISNEVLMDSTKTEREVFEKELYTFADRIITTPILLKESEEIYSKDIVNKMIPMEFPNVVPISESNQRSSDKIRCVFTGNIYGDFRNPEYTLRLFDNVKSQISFEMIGSVNSSTKTQLDSHNVLYHGPKSLEETKIELVSSDILVNIGNKMTNQVPSKLFEYISYGKPIINICKNRNCPTLPYLEKYKYVLNLYEEEEIFEEQIKVLNDFILNNHRNRMTVDEILKAFDTCTPQYCAQQMLDVFDSLKE